MPKRAPVPAPECARAVIYCRVSTARQAEDGISLDTQEGACRKLCTDRGIEVAGVFKDAGMSGKLEDRPGLLRAIAATRDAPGTAVVVYSLSRLARSQKLIWGLLDDRGPHALQVVSATEPFDTTTAMGRAFLGMLATFAQLESDLAGERTKAALAYAREQGTKLGAPSMVESTNERGDRIIDRTKVELIKRVQQLHRETGYGQRQLADFLNANEIPSVTGAKWHGRTVGVALKIDIGALRERAQRRCGQNEEEIEA